MQPSGAAASRCRPALASRCASHERWLHCRRSPCIGVCRHPRTLALELLTLDSQCQVVHGQVRRAALAALLAAAAKPLPRATPPASCNVPSTLPCSSVRSLTRSPASTGCRLTHSLGLGRVHTWALASLASLAGCCSPIASLASLGALLGTEGLRSLGSLARRAAGCIGRLRCARFARHARKEDGGALARFTRRARCPPGSRARFARLARLLLQPQSIARFARFARRPPGDGRLAFARFTRSAGGRLHQTASLRSLRSPRS